MLVQAASGDAGSFPRNIALIDTCAVAHKGTVSAKLINLSKEDAWIQPRRRIGIVLPVRVLRSSTDTVRVTDDGIYLDDDDEKEVRSNQLSATRPEDPGPLPFDIHLEPNTPDTSICHRILKLSLG